jgi:hypothetical protein
MRAPCRSAPALRGAVSGFGRPGATRTKPTLARSTVRGPLRLFANVRNSSMRALVQARRRSGRVRGAKTPPFAALRVPCAPRPLAARHNSLRSLRSLRSDRCRESDDEARGYARRPKACGARRRLCAAPAPRSAPCRRGCLSSAPRTATASAGPRVVRRRCDFWYSSMSAGAAPPSGLALTSLQRTFNFGNGPQAEGRLASTATFRASRVARSVMDH